MRSQAVLYVLQKDLQKSLSWDELIMIVMNLPNQCKTILTSDGLGSLCNTALWERISLTYYTIKFKSAKQIRHFAVLLLLVLVRAHCPMHFSRFENLILLHPYRESEKAKEKEKKMQAWNFSRQKSVLIN